MNKSISIICFLYHFFLLGMYNDPDSIVITFKGSDEIRLDSKEHLKKHSLLFQDIFSKTSCVDETQCILSTFFNEQNSTIEMPFSPTIWDAITELNNEHVYHDFYAQLILLMNKQNHKKDFLISFANAVLFLENNRYNADLYKMFDKIVNLYAIKKMHENASSPYCAVQSPELNNMIRKKYLLFLSENNTLGVRVLVDVDYTTSQIVSNLYKNQVHTYVIDPGLNNCRLAQMAFDGEKLEIRKAQNALVREYFGDSATNEYNMHEPLYTMQSKIKSSLSPDKNSNPYLWAYNVYTKKGCHLIKGDTLFFWDMGSEQKKLLSTCQLVEQPIRTHMGYTAQGRYLFFGYQNGSIDVFRLMTGVLTDVQLNQPRHYLPLNLRVNRTIQHIFSDIMDTYIYVLYKAAKIAVIGINSDDFVVFDTKEEGCVHTFATQPITNTIAWYMSDTIDGQNVKQLIVKNIKNPAEEKNIPIHTPACVLTFHPSLPVLAVGDSNGAVHLVDVHKEYMLRVIRQNSSYWNDTLLSMYFSSCGNKLMVANSCTQKIIDLSTAINLTQQENIADLVYSGKKAFENNVNPHIKYDMKYKNRDRYQAYCVAVLGICCVCSMVAGAIAIALIN